MNKSKPRPPQAQFSKDGLRQLWSFVRGGRLSMVLAMLAVTLSSFGNVALNALLKPIVNSLVDPEGFANFVRYLLIAALAVLISSLLSWLGNRSLAHLAQFTGRSVRDRLFRHMQRLPVAFYDSHKQGELMSAYTNDVDQIVQALEQVLPNLLLSFFYLAGTLVMMFVLSVPLTLLMLFMVALMLLSLGRIGKLSAGYFQSQQKNIAELNGYAEEMIKGQKVVKVFGREAACLSEFEGYNADLRESSSRAQTFATVMMPIVGNLGYAQYAAVAMVGALLVARGSLDIGSIAAFLQYARSFTQPLTTLSSQMSLLFGAFAGAERIAALLNEPPESDAGDVELADGNAAREALCWRLPEADGGCALVPVRGDIRVTDLRFAYEEGKEVLRGISFYAKPGQKIALVGSTGAGKTTITNLINRFYELGAGRIELDGIDIRRIRKPSLRRILGMVLQDVRLFEGSVADNIRFGKLDATRAEIEAAARIANADAFIRKLPEGYDTPLEKDGANLSQGQRQLISIARAAVADPVVLVLDEATSSIDTRTERLIERGMDALMKERTTVSIAHRLSTVRHANAIMVLEHGEIIERGDHDDLIAQRGRYYELNMGTAELS